jgi:hypothetical protein
MRRPGDGIKTMAMSGGDLRYFDFRLIILAPFGSLELNSIMIIVI